MTKTAIASPSRFLTVSIGLAAAVLVTGCVSYSPSRLASMSTIDLCELRETQGRNLSEDTRRALQGELQRRNDSCTNHAAVLAQRRQDFMQQEMYGKHDDP